MLLVHDHEIGSRCDETILANMDAIKFEVCRIVRILSEWLQINSLYQTAFSAVKQGLDS